MNWKVKIIEDYGVDDNLRQSVLAIIVDEDGNQIDSLRRDFYGDPDVIRTEADKWRVEEINKANLALQKEEVLARKLNIGELI